MSKEQGDLPDKDAPNEVPSSNNAALLYASTGAELCREATFPLDSPTLLFLFPFPLPSLPAAKILNGSS
jgi:hypothetical protein